MNIVNRHLSAAAQGIGSGPKRASCVFGLLALCALAAAMFLIGKEGSASPATRSVRVSLAGLDLSTPDGARYARERIRKAALDLCARNPSQRSIDWCVDQAMAAAQRQIEAHTVKVSLADLDLSTPQGVSAARDRLQAAAGRVCQESQASSDLALTHYSACVDETFESALQRAGLLQRTNVDF
jgi:UrcA family protein